MTFLQLYGDYLDIELGTEDRTALFTTARRKDAINRAQMEFVKQTECLTRSVLITVADSDQEFDLGSASVIPDQDFMLVGKDGVEYQVTDPSGNITYRSGEDFPRRDLDVLNREDEGWRGAESQTYPSSYYIREDAGITILGLSEPALVDTGYAARIRLPYVAVPASMTDDAQEPFGVSGFAQTHRLRPWHQALVHYGAALLEPLRKNYAGETRQRQLFASYVADYLQRMRKKGGSRIVMARDYRAEASGRSQLSRPQRDWRVWP